MGRMLLSHNFDLRQGELPALMREDFAQVFIDGLEGKQDIQCRYIQNPHWVVEILFPTDKYEAREIGQLCGEILTSKRRGQQPDSQLTTDTLILGGKKTTPTTSTSPTSLKTGEWGVDVVETAQVESFLTSINWDSLSADKPSDGIFKIEFMQQ